MLEGDGLLGWVDGTHSYATRVTINEDGFSESRCTCPYGYDRKQLASGEVKLPMSRVKKDIREISRELPKKTGLPWPRCRRKSLCVMSFDYGDLGKRKT